MNKVLKNKNNNTIKNRCVSGSVLIEKRNLTKEEKYLIKNVGNAIKRLSNT